VFLVVKMRTLWSQGQPRPDRERTGKLPQCQTEPKTSLGVVNWLPAAFGKSEESLKAMRQPRGQWCHTPRCFAAAVARCRVARAAGQNYRRAVLSVRAVTCSCILLNAAPMPQWLPLRNVGAFTPTSAEFGRGTGLAAVQ
jgi:hypothetical protein